MWEKAAILGGVTPDPGPPTVTGAFPGLQQLVAMGAGQLAVYSNFLSASHPLTVLDGQMTRIRSHNRRVDLIVTSQAGWVELLSLHRSLGLTPDIRMASETGQNCLYYNNVPVCISDFIPIDTPVTEPPSPSTTDFYFMTLGEPDGVFAIVNKNYPDVTMKQTHNENSAFMSYQADFYSALVSTTSDALVRLSGFPLTALG